MPSKSRRLAMALILATATLLLLGELWAAIPAGPGHAPVPPPTMTGYSRQLGAPPAVGERRERPSGPAGLAAGQDLSAQVIDWLGPAAPLALSPFFGVTCLSGLAIWGPDWLQARGWLQPDGPLNSPWVFWVFLSLTLLTSLPRFIKVTKPLAQLAEQVELYSVLVMLLVVRFAVGNGGETDPAGSAAGPVVAVAGIGAFTGEVLLYVALLINLIVINAVKICFELLVWMTPVPFIDALFELANKSFCGGLMALYAFSPFLATVFNLLIFTAAALVFRWVSRITVFYRTILLDYALATLFGRSWRAGDLPVIGFNSNPWRGYAPRSCLALDRAEAGWTIGRCGWFRFGREIELPDRDYRLEIVPGALTSDLIWSGPNGEKLLLVITRRYADAMPDLARLLNGRLVSHPVQTQTV